MNALGLICYFLAIAFAVVGFSQQRPTGRFWYIALLTGALFAFQRDALSANFQLWNPDESQMIAGAQRLLEHPVFWRDVDGTTHGPLAQWPLVLPAVAGFRLDYIAARWAGILIIVLTLLGLHAGIARRWTEPVAKLLVLPAWTYFIFNQDPEAVQYTSELMPGLLIAWGAVGILQLLAEKSPARSLLLVGMTSSAAPLAKLQAAPLGAWLFLFASFIIWQQSGRARLRSWLLLWGAALLPIAVFVGPAWWSGAAADFRIRYLATNLLGYATNGGAVFFNQAWPTPDLLFGYSAFFWPVLALAGMGLAHAIARRLAARREVVFTLGLAVVGLAAIVAPHKPFGHYYLLGIGPLILLLGAGIGPVLQILAGTATTRLSLALVAALLLAGPCGFHRWQHPGYLRAVLPSRPLVSRPLVEALQRHTQPGQHLAVWGWQPALYVMTQTISATPDLIIFWQTVPSPWRQFYQDRYLRDLTAHPPEAFVDTMGPADFFFSQAPAAPHENFPALQEFVARNYEQVEEVAGCRIYKRHDTTSAPHPEKPIRVN